MKLLSTLLFVITLPVMAIADTNARLSVTGMGQVAAEPDMAILTLGVTSLASSAKDAMRKNSSDMAAVFKAVEGAGIDSKDVQTSNFSLRPRFDRRSNNNPPKLEGYQATNTITIRVRALDTLGSVIDQLAQAGANQFQGIEFALKNPRPFVDQARKSAVEDARSKAELYATAAGLSLGDILSIKEAGGAPRPVPMARIAIEAASDAVPIAQGELGLSAHVTIVYELVN